jgi:anion-transporting  ArsA/GET3 family ATPase
MECLPGVSAVNIHPGLALAEYGELVLKVKTISNAVFGNEYIKAFLRAVPGLQEWAMLGKAWFHTTEQGPDGRNRFDVVIFDAPATGHGLDMLRVPNIILEVAPPGVLRRDVPRRRAHRHRRGHAARGDAGDRDGGARHGHSR